MSSKQFKKSVKLANLRRCRFSASFEKQLTSLTTEMERMQSTVAVAEQVPRLTCVSRSSTVIHISDYRSWSSAMRHTEK